MKEQSSYEEAKRKAVLKKEMKLQLSKKEKIASQGLWYFNAVIPVNLIDEVITISEKYNIKPSDLVAVWIRTGLNNES